MQLTLSVVVLLASCGLPSSTAILFTPHVILPSGPDDTDLIDIRNRPVRTGIYYDPDYIQGYEFYYYIMTEDYYEGLVSKNSNNSDKVMKYLETSFALKILNDTTQKNYSGILKEQNDNKIYRFVKLDDSGKPLLKDHTYPITDINFEDPADIYVDVKFRFTKPTVLTNYAAKVEIIERAGSAVSTDVVYLYRRVYDDLITPPKEVGYKDFNGDSSFKYIENSDGTFSVDEDISKENLKVISTDKEYYYVAYFVTAYGLDSAKLKFPFSTPSILGIQKLSISLTEAH